METIFIFLVGVLFVLAISDLIVGVSNDAVNFLNSAIGSKAAPFWAIMIIASLGIIFGATFSSGMMEVARKGIFHPEYFYFSEIIFIFLAVMITDVILLDAFNTFGLPTSTTVSIVFELLGAAVGITLIKIYTQENALEIYEYINTDKALAIISGILLSVVIAFTVGAIVQYITRLIFSFDLKNNLTKYGAIWGGIAITAITYFILIKGAKGASFMHADTKDWIKNNSIQIIMYSLIAWTILLQILRWIFKLNILKTIVLVGTFALAMAFAGNDLVNFIGVPLAGFESWKIFTAAPEAQPDNFLMEALSGKVKTPTLFLIIAGLIMVITLWLSRKARSVLKTSLDLSRQEEGVERFESSMLARGIVRFFIEINKGLMKIMPQKVLDFINKQFDHTHFHENEGKDKTVSFDLLRASVNLVVASILISFATSLKLPLSTTYVTFMVAMGTSLADRAWGRESAVYRVSGVITVIGGWFMTAFVAFTVAMVAAFIIYFGEIYSISALLIIAGIVMFRTHVLHKKREKAAVEDGESFDIFEKCSLGVISNLNEISETYNYVIDGLITENRKTLQKAKKKAKAINNEAKEKKDSIFATIYELRADAIDSGPYYVQELDYLREMAHCVSFIATPSFLHIDNNHKGLYPFQIENLKRVKSEISEIITSISEGIKSNKFDNLDNIVSKQQQILKIIDKLKKEQIKSIKNAESGTKNSMLYFDILNETKNLILHSLNLFKSHRDFAINSKRTSLF